MIANFSRFVTIGSSKPDGTYVDFGVTEEQLRAEDERLEAIVRDCPVRLYDDTGNKVRVRVESIYGEFICITPYPNQPITRIKPVRAVVNGSITLKKPKPEEFYSRSGEYDKYVIMEIKEEGKPTFFIHTMNPHVSPSEFRRRA